MNAVRYEEEQQICRERFGRSFQLQVSTEPRTKGPQNPAGIVIAIITLPANTRFLVNKLSHLHSHCLYINNTLCKQKSVLFINDCVGGDIFTSTKHPTQKFPFHNRLLLLVSWNCSLCNIKLLISFMNKYYPSLCNISNLRFLQKNSKEF